VLLLAIVAFGVPLALSLSARVSAEVRTQAQAQADLVAATAADLLTPSNRHQLTTLARQAAASVHGRVLIVDASGGVLADSAGPAQLGAGYGSRPELERALRGHPVQVQRVSRTLGEEILATAVPIVHDGRTAGAVRVTQSVGAMRSAVRRVELALILIGVIVLALGLLAGALLAGHIVRPLRRLEAVARRVAQGDLSARAELEGSREQRSLSSSFNEMTDRIERLLGAQQGFVADASHQLRTPLTGLRLRLEEAKAMSDRPDLEHELDAAIGELDRLSYTVDELLLLSRDGERRPAAAPLDIAELGRVATQRWHPQAADRRQSIVFRCEGEPGVAWAARADIERALDALIENALRYSRAATTVTVLARPGRLEIRDHGPGVAAGERDLVFGRFHRGRVGRGGPAGHGLGLPIARELAREWGGEVTLEAGKRGGTTAILQLGVDGPRTPSLQRLNPGQASVASR
jgi:signal transduction histidine kinase